jgi:hypothetical protein
VGDAGCVSQFESALHWLARLLGWQTKFKGIRVVSEMSVTTGQLHREPDLLHVVLLTIDVGVVPREFLPEGKP